MQTWSINHFLPSRSPNSTHSASIRPRSCDCDDDQITSIYRQISKLSNLYLFKIYNLSILTITETYFQQVCRTWLASNQLSHLPIFFNTTYVRKKQEKKCWLKIVLQLVIFLEIKLCPLFHVGSLILPLSAEKTLRDPLSHSLCGKVFWVSRRGQ